MRDARPACRQERGDRRTRRLARRRVTALIAFYADAFSRLLVASLCATFAFVLWDLTGRNPSTIGRDLARAFGHAPALLRGCARAGIGLIFVLFALLLVATVFIRPRDFSVAAIAIVLAALAVDALVGDAFRAGIGLRR